MNAGTLPLSHDRRENLRGTLLLSLALHGGLFGTAFGYTRMGLRIGGGGQSWGIGRSARVSAVSSLPGVPLPAPMLATRSTLATENPGLYKNEPRAREEETPSTVAIPKFEREAKPERALRVNRRIQRAQLDIPENAVPFGLGGRPSLTYTQFSNVTGQGGLSFGEGNFGERYSLYVAAARNHISSNWLLSTVSPNILSAPRVYIDFDIIRDGTIRNVQITQSSRIPEVDRSALRAVLASNPLGPLPSDYAGDKVSVEFYFDFHRR